MDHNRQTTGESWSEMGSFSTGHSRRRGDYERPSTCACGLPPVLRTSRTDSNPARRFWRCSSPRDLQCTYYYWIDPEVAAPVKEYIKVLKVRVKSLETVVERGERSRLILVTCTVLSWIIMLGVVCTIW